MQEVERYLERFKKAEDRQRATSSLLIPFVEALKNAVARCVILSPSVQRLEFKGQNMVLAVFEALASDSALLLPRSRDLSRISR